MSPTEGAVTGALIVIALMVIVFAVIIAADRHDRRR